jgi:hypothetical protein
MAGGIIATKKTEIEAKLLCEYLNTIFIAPSTYRFKEIK